VEFLREIATFRIRWTWQSSKAKTHAPADCHIPHSLDLAVQQSKNPCSGGLPHPAFAGLGSAAKQKPLLRQIATFRIRWTWQSSKAKTHAPADCHIPHSLDLAVQQSKNPCSGGLPNPPPKRN